MAFTDDEGEDFAADAAESGREFKQLPTFNINRKGIGTSIEGVIVGRYDEPDRFNESRRNHVLVIRTDDEKVWRLPCWGSVLGRQVNAHDPQIGDYVTITYVSDTDVGMASPRRDFTFEVERAVA